MTAAKIAPELVDEMTGWRHDFHRRPELGFDEHRTSARVAELLREFGLEVHTGIGGTGVVGVAAARQRVGQHRLSRRYGRASDHRDRTAGMAVKARRRDACLRP